jgi:hypothetical protein
MKIIHEKEKCKKLPFLSESFILHHPTQGVEKGVYKRFPVTKAVSNYEMYLNKASITDNRKAARSQQQHFLGRQN